MQKDYLRRKARQESAAASSVSATVSDSGSPSTAASSHLHRLKHLPHRQGTLGSTKDSAGGEVKEDRVILYIHGTLRRRFFSRSQLMIGFRRSILLLIARHAPLSDPEALPKGWCSSILASVPLGSPVPLRKSRPWPKTLFADSHRSRAACSTLWLHTYTSFTRLKGNTSRFTPPT